MEPRRRRYTDRQLVRLTITAIVCWAVIATIGVAVVIFEQIRQDNAIRTAVQAKQLATAIQQSRTQDCEAQNTRHIQTDGYVVSVFSAVIKSAQTAEQRMTLQIEETEYEQLVQDLAPLRDCKRAVPSSR